MCWLVFYSRTVSKLFVSFTKYFLLNVHIIYFSEIFIEMQVALIKKLDEANFVTSKKNFPQFRVPKNSWMLQFLNSAF